MRPVTELDSNDHAQAADSKLFVSGGGVVRSWVTPQPPHVITLGVAAVVKVPYTATNQPHTLTITLVDEDGNGVSPFVPDGVPDPGPIRSEFSFNLGRPAGLSPGEAQPYCLAANFNIGLRQLGGYIFELAIDGTKMKELSKCEAVRRWSVKPSAFVGPLAPSELLYRHSSGLGQASGSCLC